MTTRCRCNYPRPTQEYCALGRATHAAGFRRGQDPGLLSLIALAAAGAAHAAALEQTVPATIRLLYQEGRYIEFGVAYTDPDQSGEGAMIPAASSTGATALPGNTGDVFETAGTSAAPTRRT